VEDLGVKTPGDLLQFSLLKLQELYGVNTGYALFFIAVLQGLQVIQSKHLFTSLVENPHPQRCSRKPGRVTIDRVYVRNNF